MHPRRATAAAAGERAARGTVVRSGVYTTPAGWGRRVILDLTGRSICCHHIAYMEAPEHTLEFLLSFDGRLHWYAEGYFVKFEIKRAAPSKERPHGLRYSLTLHGPGGKRLVGFDNAHGAWRQSGPVMADVSLLRTTGTEPKPTPADRIGSGMPRP
jgi:hypothetical protein